MLQKEGMSKNPNLVPIGDKSERLLKLLFYLIKDILSLTKHSFDFSNPKSEEKIDRDQKKKSFRQAKDEFERRKNVAEKKQKADVRKQKFLEKQEAIKAYKSKKAEKFKVLSRKNSKGQPIMAGRMELLLEKIKASS